MYRKTFVVLVALLLAGSALAGTQLASSHTVRAPAKRIDGTAVVKNVVSQLQSIYGAAADDENWYVGSYVCLACHTNKSTWKDTKHNQALRQPRAEYTLMAGKGVVADYDQNGVDDFMQGLDFNTISSVFDPYKPNAPKLSYANGTYYVTIGELTCPVIMTQGGTGDWKQRYLLKVPVTDTATGLSAENYVSPIQFNEKTHAYVLYHADAWYDAANMPKFGATTTTTDLAANNNRGYSRSCIGCHATGIRSLGQTASGEWVWQGWVAAVYDPADPGVVDYDGDGNMDLVNIGCESCHGPGLQHVLGGGDGSKIVDPAELTPAEQNEVCGQCHSRVKSVPGGLHGWPYDDANEMSWYPGSGMPLDGFYTDAAGRWPDAKTSKQHHQQYFDFYESSKPTFQFHMVVCTECHDPHSAAGEHMLRTSIDEDGLTIPTNNDNNTLCLACHATHGDFETITKEMVADLDNNIDHIENVVSAHSHHPYGPDRKMGLSRCSKCHMAKTAKSAINYDIHSHTFEPIPPEKTTFYAAQGGMPNACAASCHATKVNSFGLGLDPDISVWNAQFDADLANKLMMYYGPGGLWWDHELGEDAPLNPDYVPPSDDSM